MKQLLPGLFVLLVFSCKQKPPAIKSEKVDSVKIVEPVVAKDTAMAEPIADSGSEEEFATYYLVEVARGRNFDSLKAISTNTASLLGSKFNMLDRIYKSGKGIIVPENADDEIYRGEYFPRRPFEDQNYVSIEMSNGFLDNEADTLEMVTIAGIYSLQSQADSVTSLLKDKIATVKTVKREMYMGCMH